jgi:hypothetical protein
MNLSSRAFPDYYIGNAKTLKIGVSPGIFRLRFKTSQINLNFDSNSSSLKIYEMTFDLDNNLIVKLTPNHSLKCPSPKFWKYIELYLLSKCERSGDKIKISASIIDDILIPKDEQTVEKVIENYFTDQNEIKEKDNNINDLLMKLYELESFTVDDESGKEIVMQYLDKW